MLTSDCVSEFGMQIREGQGFFDQGQVFQAPFQTISKIKAKNTIVRAI